MQKILTFLRGHIILVCVVIGIALIALFMSAGDDTPDWVTDTVSQGVVRTIISVSGVVDAVSTAELAFPSGGILESVSVKEGDIVTKGQLLATLSHNDLNADYQDALASVLIAEADRNELVNGMSKEERDISKTTKEIAQDDLLRITNEQNDRVTNAYRTLLSSDLEAQPKNLNGNSLPPVVTGAYTCSEGTYTLDLYSSNAQSRYSYRLSGVETGTYTAYTDTAGPLGKCGLNIQFIDGQSYGNSQWTITIPNTKGASFVTNLNSYNLAVTQRENAIHEAEQNLTLAEQNNTLDTATPRAEALSRAEARVLQAKARLNVVGSQIRDHVLSAPFAGTVTNIEPVPGEAVGTTPIITMVSDEAFALTALVPEIDVTKIRVGQKADVVFDARESETLVATLIFISPLAKEVDGVSYFEAKLVLDNEVDWLRSGLNADVDIIVDTHENVTRIPKRYLKEADGKYTVLTPNGNDSTPTPVDVTFMGNDGFVEITGLDTGQTIIAP